MPNTAAEAKVSLFDLEEVLRRRFRKRMSQAELAEATGMSPGNLSKLLNGKMLGSPDAWGRIADALGCTIEDLERKPARRRAS